MSVRVLCTDRIPMSQTERDVLKIMHVVILVELGFSRRLGAMDSFPPARCQAGCVLTPR
jgi:hypothetical protein